VKIVREFVIKNNSWPKSWEDLEQIPPHKVAEFIWPRSREQLQKYVSVDFEADIDKLALESKEQFDAIHPKGACYPYDDEIQELLDTIRQLRKDGSRNSIGMDTKVEPPPDFLATKTAASVGRCCPTLMSKAISKCSRKPIVA